MNTLYFQRVADIKGENELETEHLQRMADSAHAYIASFDWCPPIAAFYLAFGVAGVVAIFYAEFSRSIGGTDSKLWVVEGDLPSAYLVVEPNDDPAQALERYCDLMDAWIGRVKEQESLEDVFPISAEPTLENAEALTMRVRFLRKEIVPLVHNSCERLH